MGFKGTGKSLSPHQEVTHACGCNSGQVSITFDSFNRVGFLFDLALPLPRWQEKGNIPDGFQIE